MRDRPDPGGDDDPNCRPPHLLTLTRRLPPGSAKCRSLIARPALPSTSQRRNLISIQFSAKAKETDPITASGALRHPCHPGRIHHRMVGDLLQNSQARRGLLHFARLPAGRGPCRARRIHNQRQPARVPAHDRGRASASPRRSTRWPPFIQPLFSRPLRA